MRFVVSNEFVRRVYEAEKGLVKEDRYEHEDGFPGSIRG